MALHESVNKKIHKDYAYIIKDLCCIIGGGDGGEQGAMAPPLLLDNACKKRIEIL